MKTFSKIGAIALLSVTAFLAPVFQGCKQETFDINTNLPNGSQTIVIPGTDLSTIEALLAEMRDLITKNQTDQLDALVQAISDENLAISGKLADLIEELKKNTTADQNQYEGVMAELAKIFKAITDLQASVCQRLNEVADYLKNDIDNNTSAINDKIGSAIDALKHANADNLVSLVNALNSEFSTLSGKLTEEVGKLDADLLAKLQLILDESAKIYANGTASKEELVKIKNDFQNLLVQMQSLLDKVDALNKDICNKIEAAAKDIISSDGKNTAEIIDAIEDAQANLASANETQMGLLINSIEEGDAQIVEWIKSAAYALDNGNLNTKLGDLNTLLAAVQQEIQANGQATSENLEAVKAQLDSVLAQLKRAVKAINNLSTALEEKINYAVATIVAADALNTVAVTEAIADAKLAIKKAGKNIIAKITDKDNEIVSAIESAVVSLNASINDGELKSSLNKKLKTLTELVDGLETSADCTNQKLDAVQNALSDILTELGNVVTSVDNLKEALLEKITKATRQIKNANAANTTEVTEAIAAAEEALAFSNNYAIGVLITEMKAGQNDIISELSSAIAAVEKATKQENKALNAQLEALKSALDSQFATENANIDTIKQRLYSLLKGMKAVITGINDVKTAIETAVTEINENIDEETGKIIANDDNNAKKIKKAIADARAAIVNADSENTKALAEVIADESSDIVKGLKKVLNKNTETLSGKLDSIISLAKKIKNATNVTNEELQELNDKMDDLLGDMDVVIRKMTAMQWALKGIINQIEDATKTIVRNATGNKNQIIAAIDANKDAIVAAIDSAELNLESALSEELAALTDTLTTLNNETIASIEAAANSINKNVNRQFKGLEKSLTDIKMVLKSIERNNEYTNRQLGEVKYQLSQVLDELRKAVYALSEIIEYNKTIIAKIDTARTMVIENATENQEKIVAAITEARTALDTLISSKVASLITAMKSGDSDVVTAIENLLNEIDANDQTTQIKLDQIKTYLAGIEDAEQLTYEELAGFQNNLSDLLRLIAQLLVNPVTDATVTEVANVSFVTSNPSKASAKVTTSMNVHWKGINNERLFSYAKVDCPTNGSTAYPESEIQAMYDAVENGIQVIAATKAPEEDVNLIKAKASLKKAIASLSITWSNPEVKTFALNTLFNLENTKVNNIVLSYETEVDYIPMVVYTKIGSTTYFVTGFRAVAKSGVNDVEFTIDYSDDYSGHGTTSHGTTYHGEITHEGTQACDNNCGGGYTVK